MTAERRKSDDGKGRSQIVRTAITVFFASAVGCTTTSSPKAGVGTNVTAAPAANVESGKLMVARNSFQDVTYSSPFASPPKLDVPSHWGNCQVVIQTPTRFRVLNTSDSDMEVTWKAVGSPASPASVPTLGSPQMQPVVRSTPAPVVQPVAAAVAQPQPSPAGGLPAEPVPVGDMH
jgi:hypothetical protein